MIEELGKHRIVDEEAYKEYLEVKASPILQPENRIIVCSDGTEVNIAATTPTIINKISHLSNEEVKKILAHKRKYSKLKSVYMGLKKKAHGINQSVPVKKRLATITKDFSILDPKKEELIELFGKMYSIKEVYEICLIDFKINCKVEHLKWFYDHYKKTIQDRVIQHQSSFDDMRLATKRSRLEELVWLYGRAKRTYRTTTMKQWSAELRDILKQIKSEVEGDLVLGGKISIEHTATAFAVKNTFEYLALRQIILSRAALRMGANSQELVEDLQASYYSMYNSLITESTQSSEDLTRVNYPSSKHYDFEAIQKKLRDSGVFDEIESEKLALSGLNREDEPTMAEQLKSAARANINTKKQKLSASREEILNAVEQIRRKQ